MYGIRPDEDLSFFIGQILIQVCFGRHDLILNFDEGVSISITSSIAIHGTKHGQDCVDDFRQAATPLLDLIEQPVTAVNASDDGKCLTLEFGASRVLVFDDSEFYESFLIQTPQKQIVV